MVEQQRKLLSNSFYHYSCYIIKFEVPGGSTLGSLILIDFVKNICSLTSPSTNSLNVSFSIKNVEACNSEGRH